MFFVIGLGNPESRYTGTRHNLGFAVADAIAGKLHISYKPGQGEYLIATGSARDSSLAIVKPLTYMNESGLAVQELQDHFGTAPDKMLVVCDDFQLPLGQLRLRLRGSDGGHNGLYSIIYHLQSDEFARLRCGIASVTMPKEKHLLADFVLDRFTTEEQPTVKTMIENAADACISAVTEGITKTMNEFNKKISKEEGSTNNQ